MPNTRRRRFSVQNGIAGRQSTKSHNSPSSHISIDDELTISVHTMVAPITNKCKSKFHANTSKEQQTTLEIVAECDSTTSLSIIKDQSEMKRNLTQNVVKDETAYSKYMYSEAESSVNDAPTDQCQVSLNPVAAHQKTGDSKQINRERTLRREKYSRQHRIKVRSPKRRTSIPEQGKSSDVTNTFNNKQSTGTIAINWEEEFESCRNVTSLQGDTYHEETPSSHSLDDMCRICHEGDIFYPELGRLISACLCRGTVGRVHVKCLERWLTESGKSRCELCGTRYTTRRVHRYGVPRALVMWILSQNAKQLMVDSLGIMLMSPLAVLAAWLTGRTLAGLMTQESHVTPWPLASTFVLACMTLVCYYCWIVSAATRHALGWWIWYRSQYEVRLELQENED